MAKDQVKEKKAFLSHSKQKRVTKISVLAVLVVVALFLTAVAGYSITHAKKTFSNVYLGDSGFSGKSKDQVAEILTAKSQDFLHQNIVLNYLDETGQKKRYEILPNDIGLVFDVDSTVAKIYGYGRDSGAMKNFVDQLKSVFKPQRFAAVYTSNEEALNKKISAIATEVDIPEKDYQISYTGNARFELLKDLQTGKRIDQFKLIEMLKQRISNLHINEINFVSETYEPKVAYAKAENRLKSANQVLDQGELKLTFSELNFTLDVDTIGALIKSRSKDDDLELFLDEAKARKQVDAIATSINREPKNAVLQAKDGLVSAFQVSELGRTLDVDQTLIDIGNALLARATDGVKETDTKTVALKVSETQPEVATNSIDTYGLKELVATGKTTFKGSSANRIHNITVGANAINGTLLKPGETFSTLGKLGEIDASAGYLPELVIKSNSTVPEYGGGLCQVSTTLFRAALNSGMEIVSRSNHKYRVSYYEPPVGMDATIYDPAPDFKFKNNYSSHILIQASVVGTSITFDLYGTKDSRVVEVGVPEVYDFTEPGPVIEVATDTLAPGERKQLEKAHQGASAKFHYKVTRDGATLQEKDFVSKYVAWPEKWLVGITPVAPVVETPPPAADAAVPAG